MSRKFAVSSALVTLSLAALTGCPTPGDGTTPSSQEIAIAGTWSGTLSCTTSEFLGQLTGPTRSGTRDLTITFDSDGVPTSLAIWGFNAEPTQTAKISAEGESATFSFTWQLREVTLVATIAEATYTATSARVVISLQYSATFGSAQFEGTGAMTIEATAGGDELAYSGVAEYEVTQSAGSISLETGETITCEGTLTRQ